ncbi:MAG: peptidase C25, partial [Flavobacteriaceae bacterium]|nr:peptidase C25 [Flavobacteriaceae bacterium]
MMKKITIVIIYFMFHISWAQNQHYEIKWETASFYSTQYKSFNIPHFNDNQFALNDDMTVSFTTQWRETSVIDPNSVRLNNVVYQNISKDELGDLTASAIPISPNQTIQMAKGRDVSYAILSLFPIINDNGQFKKIISFDVSYSFAARNSVASVRGQANSASALKVLSNSVLAQGDFYKFYVDKSGIFKITRRDLQNMGLNVSQIDPKKLKIYGNGGKMLPLLNNIPKPIDVTENAIFVSGQDDGKFDNNDFVLFYAQGPHNWTPESNTNINLYTDEIAYFITAEGVDGKRIQEAVQPTASPTLIVDTFDEFQFHEKDIVSVANVGREWHGEKFDINNEQTFSFDFPNLVLSDPVKIRINVAAAADNITSMDVNVNGQVVSTLSFTAINDPTVGSGNTFNGNLTLNSGKIDVKLTYNNNGNPTGIGFLN